MQTGLCVCVCGRDFSAEVIILIHSRKLICHWIFYIVGDGKVAQSCPTLGDPMDCSPPGSSVLGILQARILEWVAMPSSSGSSRPRDGTWVSCIAGGFFTTHSI